MGRYKQEETTQPVQRCCTTGGQLFIYVAQVHLRHLQVCWKADRDPVFQVVSVQLFGLHLNCFRSRSIPNHGACCALSNQHLYFKVFYVCVVQTG